MAQEPKKRHSRARQGKRRAHIVLKLQQAVICKNCGAATQPHTVCASCGFYKGEQIIAKKSSSKASQQSAQ